MQFSLFKNLSNLIQLHLNSVSEQRTHFYLTFAGVYLNGDKKCQSDYRFRSISIVRIWRHVPKSQKWEKWGSRASAPAGLFPPVSASPLRPHNKDPNKVQCQILLTHKLHPTDSVRITGLPFYICYGNSQPDHRNSKINTKASAHCEFDRQIHYFKLFNIK